VFVVNEAKIRVISLPISASGACRSSAYGLSGSSTPPTGFCPAHGVHVLHEQMCEESVC